MKIFRLVLLLTGALLCVQPSMAAYPDRPITFVVPFGPGGTVDIFGRSMALHLSKKLNVPVQVVNKPGANTRIGIDYALRQPHDGYTVLLSSFSPYMQGHLLFDKSKTYSLEDIAFINVQWMDPYIIGVHKDTPYKTLPELMEAIKANPKKIRAGTTAGSPGQIVLMQLLKAYDIPKDNLNLMLYQNGGMAIPAIVGNQVDFIINSVTMMERVTDASRNIAAVEETALTVAGESVPALNDTLKGTGLSIRVMSGGVTRGFAVSAKMKAQHPDRYATLIKAFKEVLEDPAVVEDLKKNQFGSTWVGPEAAEQSLLDGLEIMKTIDLEM